jgi:hypothetical protein
MPGVVPDVGEVRMLATMLGVAPPEALQLRLFVNDRIPGLADDVVDYIEMRDHGYARKTLTPDVWTIEPATAGLNTPGKAEAPDQVFPFTAGRLTLVYGYLLVGAGSGVLWTAERFANGPYRVETEGEIGVTPVLRLRSGYP